MRVSNDTSSMCCDTDQFQYLRLVVNSTGTDFKLQEVWKMMKQASLVFIMGRFIQKFNEKRGKEYHLQALPSGPQCARREPDFRFIQSVFAI